jgi:class 3 adenylate cyclase
MVDIAHWLQQLGLQQYADAFRDNDIDDDILIDLSEVDLERLGVASLGHRKRLLKAIAQLRSDGSGEALASTAGPTPTIEPALRAGAVVPGQDAERRQLTVMFVDLVGSTALAARLDPEDMREVIRTYQDRCAAVVRRWGGHVAKFMGDGVLV